MTATVATRTGRVGGLVRVREWFSKSAVQIVLVVVAIFWMVPGIGLLVTSFRPLEKVAESGWWNTVTSPGQLTTDNYSNLLGNDTLVDAVVNTLLIAIPSTVLPILLAAAAGYALAWIDFKGRDAVFLLIVAMLMVPLQMALIPVFRIFRTVGVSGIPAVVLFHTAFGLPFAVFLMRNYFAGLPKSLMEAARIDGASEWRIFYRIVLPLGFPAIASLAIFQFTWTWNDLLVALVFSGEQKPLMVFISNRLGQFGSGIDIISTAVFVSALVPLGIFFAFQKYFEAGLLGGSVK